MHLSSRFTNIPTIICPLAVPVRIIVPSRLIAQALPPDSVAQVAMAKVPEGIFTTPPDAQASKAATSGGPRSVTPSATAPYFVTSQTLVAHFASDVVSGPTVYGAGASPASTGPANQSERAGRANERREKREFMVTKTCRLLKAPVKNSNTTSSASQEVIVIGL